MPIKKRIYGAHSSSGQDWYTVELEFAVKVKKASEIIPLAMDSFSVCHSNWNRAFLTFVETFLVHLYFSREIHVLSLIELVSYR